MAANNKQTVGEMPRLQVSPSLFCNLQCPYCAVRTDRLAKTEGDLFLSEAFREKIGSLSNLHINVNGGEPLIHVKGVKSLIRMARKNGHILSFNTNLAMPTTILADLFDDVPVEILARVNACHHLWSGVDDTLFSRNVFFLREKGISVCVKYLAIPDDFDKIAHYLDFWDNEDIRSHVTILIGQWGDRIFPEEYTTEEIKFILPRTNNLSYALQFLGPLESKGLPCRAGNDSLFWNASGHGEMIACCQAGNADVEWDDTFFATGIKQSLPCRGSLCWTSTMITSVAGIVEKYQNSLEPDGQRHPTIPELVTLARKIEGETGRSFTSWPAFLEQTAKDMGLGTVHDDLSAMNKKECFSLSEGQFLPKLEVRSFGGAPFFDSPDGCITIRKSTGGDSLRTPFFDIMTAGAGRRCLLFSFESARLDLGAFSWRLVVQNSKLDTLTKRTFRYDADGEKSIDRLDVPVFFWGNDRTVRLILAPVGPVGSTFVLGKALRIHTLS